MEQALVQLEAHPSDDEAIRAIFRGAHTIKGNAATLGLRAVTELAHLYEDVLARLRERALAPSSALTSLLLRALDVLREAIPLAVGGAEALPPGHEAVRRALERVRAGGSVLLGEASQSEEPRPIPDEGRTLR